MSCCATRTRRIIVDLIITAALVVATGGMPVAWSADSDAFEAPFEGPVHLDDSSLPDPTRTPGDAFEHVKSKDLCDDDADKSRRVPSSALCDSVFADYQIPLDGRFQYQCSYLVPLGVGGAATQMNVWPQPVAEAAYKDKLDIELHNQVCSDTISPVQAQREIVSDWVKTYRHYVLLNDPPPLVIESRASDEPTAAPGAPSSSGLGANLGAPTDQGAPTNLVPYGTPLERRRRDPRVGSNGGNGQAPQSANAMLVQNPPVMSQQPVAIAPQRRAASTESRRAVNFVPRRMRDRLRTISR